MALIFSLVLDREKVKKMISGWRTAAQQERGEAANGELSSDGDSGCRLLFKVASSL